jgi:anaerobic magnesium-protoporphyrin IX monomethyl ester cyclase
VKIHFIYPDVSTFYYPGVHHGLASIISVLKAGGHGVSLYHAKREPLKKDILEAVQREKPDVIAFSSVTNQIDNVAKWSQWVKQEYKVPTICGGVHTTLYPEEVINFEGIDMVCRGEGEYPLLDFASDPERTDIGNLWIKKNGEITRNPLRPLIDPLDSLPFPDYELFDCASILKDRGGDFAILASRGCPFNCTYCCNHALQKVHTGKGKYFRMQSIEYILDNIASLLSRYPIKHLTFADDVFGLSQEWALEFCRKYPERFDLEFTCNLRADMVNDELLAALKKAHCTQVDMGVEAGNERLRVEVLRRRMTNEQIIRAFDSAHKFGIKTLAYNMIGLPYETPEMIRETINLNKRLSPTQAAVFFFYPYPGTELHEVCRKEGFLSAKHAESYVSESVLELPTVTRRELQKLYTEFYQYVIERRIQGLPSPLRFPARVTNAVLLKIFGKRAVEALMKIYLRFFRLFSFLQKS